MRFQMLNTGACSLPISIAHSPVICVISRKISKNSYLIQLEGWGSSMASFYSILFHLPVWLEAFTTNDTVTQLSLEMPPVYYPPKFFWDQVSTLKMSFISVPISYCQRWWRNTYLYILKVAFLSRSDMVISSSGSCPSSIASWNNAGMDIQLEGWNYADRNGSLFKSSQ